MSSPRAKLIDHLAGRIHNQLARREGHSTAPRHIVVPDRGRIGDADADLLIIDAKLFGRHQGQGCPRTANVWIPGNHRNRSIVIDHHRSGRLKARVKPHTRGDPTTLLGLQGRVVVRMILGGLERLDQSDSLIARAERRLHTLPGRVT